MAAAAIVFDLEFTSWPGAMRGRWLEPGQFKEVVQIGAVRLDAVSLAETGALNLLVKPVINPILSEYVERLTGISNARLAAEGLDFPAAYAKFVDFAQGGSICAYGRDDLVLLDNARLLGLSGLLPLPAYQNITLWLRQNGIDPTGHHACHVGPLCGAPFTGHEHDALDDARSVADGIRALVARGAENPFSDTA